MRYAENGQRSVPLARTLRNLEDFLLRSPIEIQFSAFRPKTAIIGKALLKYDSPAGPASDRVYFGKGLSPRQNVASACFEFFERDSARMRPADPVLEATFDEVSGEAVDPRRFHLAPGSLFDPAQPIDWVWGTSLSRNIPILVPACLVFLPYVHPESKKDIALADSNGLASGNNIEEAILHGLLEIIERDQVIISEYNRLPFQAVRNETVPDVCRPTIELLEAKGFQVRLLRGASDIPIPFMAALLLHAHRARQCSVAFGCHLDPTIALERALTEAIQLLPPSARHGEWMNAGAPRNYLSEIKDEIPFGAVENQAGASLKESIETCVRLLAEIGSEVIVFDLTRPGIPFPAVRVLGTEIQPCLHKNSLRVSRRFFEVPIKLGHRDRPLPRSRVKIRPILGYR